MSDLYSKAEDDDIFNEWLESEEKKAADAKAKKENGGYTKTFENIKYVGLSKDHPTIVRFVGNFVEEDPLAHRKNPSDMKFMHISKIKDDAGKVFYLYLPLRGDDPETDHIMWRIIDTVFKKEWIKDPKTGKNKSVDINKEKHPDIYEMVAKGGFTEADGKWPYMYARGWKGPEMLLINCIDRRDDWCKTNKHTKLISKSVNVATNKDGQDTEYAEFGVPAFGFYNKLAELRKNFKQGWEHYDVVITRTGEGKDTVNNLFNGTAFTTPAALQAKLDVAMGIDPSEYKYVSQEPELTDEELSYQRYDLDENFKTTSYRTLKKKLFKSIQKIDLAFDTHFADELTKLEEEEAAKWKAENEAKKEKVAPEDVTKDTEGYSVETTVYTSNEEKVEATAVVSPSFDDMQKVEEAPAGRTVVPEATPASTGLAPEKIALLKGYNELSDSEKDLIEDVIVNADGTLKNIKWKESAPALLPCPTEQGGCGFESPNSFTVCPVCAKHFA